MVVNGITSDRLLKYYEIYFDGFRRVAIIEKKGQFFQSIYSFTHSGELPPLHSSIYPSVYWILRWNTDLFDSTSIHPRDFGTCGLYLKYNILHNIHILSNTYFSIFQRREGCNPSNTPGSAPALAPI